MSRKIPQKKPRGIKRPKPPPPPPKKDAKPNSSIELMHSVAKNIIDMEFKNSDTIGTIKRRFYSIMRRHGIKLGERDNGGITIANPEWTMAKRLFASRVADHFTWIGIFEDIPKDLEAY